LTPLDAAPPPLDAAPPPLDAAPPPLDTVAPLLLVQAAMPSTRLRPATAPHTRLFVAIRVS
jgi:hypothetical protein